jgi:colicin import membrane protein
MALALRPAYDSLQPRSPGGTWPGVALSLLVHGLLLAALVWGVRWSTPVVDVVAAELWAAVPQAAPAPPQAAAAPAPAAPAPTPKPAAAVQRQADIALDKAREAKAEKERAEKDARNKRLKEEREKLESEKSDWAAKAEKAEREAKAKAEADRKAKAAEDQRQAKQREENLARMMGQAGVSGPTQAPTSGSAGGAPSASYAGRLIAAIKPNIVFTETLTGNPAAEVEVRTGPAGTIIGRTLVKSSGSPEWDEAVLRAIDRTGTLPRDLDGRVPARLSISFRPRD